MAKPATTITPNIKNTSRFVHTETTENGKEKGGKKDRKNNRTERRKNTFLSANTVEK